MTTTERTPSHLVSITFCIVVLAGGALGGFQWLQDTCPTPAAAAEPLATVCSAVIG